MSKHTATSRAISPSWYSEKTGTLPRSFMLEILLFTKKKPPHHPGGQAWTWTPKRCTNSGTGNNRIKVCIVSWHKGHDAARKWKKSNKVHSITNVQEVEKFINFGRASPSDHLLDVVGSVSKKTFQWNRNILFPVQTRIGLKNWGRFPCSCDNVC